MRRAHWLIGALALTWGATACGTVEPGDYIVYRVASSASELSDGCYWQYQGNDANVRQDSSSLKASKTFVLYAGIETSRYLDVGTVTLDGEYTGVFTEGDVYEFDGRVVDINFDNPAGTGSGAKRTTTVQTTVDMTVDGELVFGTVRVKSTWSCNGEGCGEQPPACTETFEFVGTEVDDVNLEHDIPAGVNTPSTSSSGPGPGPGPGPGGAGGAGGEGGQGGAGGGGECSSCGQVILGDGALSTTDLCEASIGPYSDLLTCACSSCASECGTNMCSDPPTNDDLCQSCVYDLCYEVFDNCIADSP